MKNKQEKTVILTNKDFFFSPRCKGIISSRARRSRMVRYVKEN